MIHGQWAALAIRVYTLNAERIMNKKQVQNTSGLILGLHPANERRRYKVTPPLISWAQT